MVRHERILLVMNEYSIMITGKFEFYGYGAGFGTAFCYFITYGYGYESISM